MHLSNISELRSDYWQVHSFNVEKVTDKDYLKIHFLFAVILTTNYIGHDVTVKISITLPDSTIISDLFSISSDFGSGVPGKFYDSTFIEKFRIKQTGLYTVRFEIQTTYLNSWDGLSVDFSCLTIKKVSLNDDNEAYDVVQFDQYYTQETDTQALKTIEQNVSFGDCQQINEIGAFLAKSGSIYNNTADWNTFGNTESIPIFDIHARNILNQKQVYKKYLNIAFLKDTLHLIGFTPNMITLFTTLNDGSAPSTKRLLPDISELKPFIVRVRTPPPDPA